NAMSLQQTPPTQVLVGIALFLTVFLMAPVFGQMNEEALQPYVEGELTMDEAFSAAMGPMRGFMINQVSSTAMGGQDLNTFLDLARQPRPESIEEIGNAVLIPAFIMGEIRRAFMIGFFIYVPFLVIDLVVASTLMSLGMMMLPPAMVSMPFKLMLFILVDGWNLIITGLMGSFH
ncbi:MAG: flagellar type III secretion system pore protein FliP, partial [Oscillospiraceae bacterium]|nr:flagellar type III secretion system pore protein FliP [Oscillospiraceae bacterium]